MINGKNIDNILKNICTGVDESESRSGRTPPIIPRAKTIKDCFMSNKPAECKGVMAIPVDIIAKLTCCSNEAIFYP